MHTQAQLASTRLLFTQYAQVISDSYHHAFARIFDFYSTVGIPCPRPTVIPCLSGGLEHTRPCLVGGDDVIPANAGWLGREERCDA